MNTFLLIAENIVFWAFIILCIIYAGRLMLVVFAIHRNKLLNTFAMSTWSVYLWQIVEAVVVIAGLIISIVKFYS